MKSEIGGVMKGTGKTDTFLGRNNRPVDVAFRGSPANHSLRLPPHVFSEAIAACERLGQGIDFARIDLLWLPGQGQERPEQSKTKAKAKDQLLFGEVTLYPGGGAHKWEPPRFDRELGRHWCTRSWDD